MKLVERNQKLQNPNFPLLIGDVKESDVVKEVNESSYIEFCEKFNYISVLFFNFV